MSEQPEVICGAKASACHCGLIPGHDGPHVCANTETCAGSWTGTYGGDDFLVVNWPTMGAAR